MISNMCLLQYCKTTMFIILIQYILCHNNSVVENKCFRAPLTYTKVNKKSTSLLLTQQPTAFGNKL